MPDFVCKTGIFGSFWGASRLRKMPNAACDVGKIDTRRWSSPHVEGQNVSFRVGFRGVVLSFWPSFAFKTEVSKRKRFSRNGCFLSSSVTPERASFPCSRSLKVGSINSVFICHTISSVIISASFCFSLCLFAAFIGHIARYALSETDKNTFTINYKLGST